MRQRVLCVGINGLCMRSPPGDWLVARSARCHDEIVFGDRDARARQVRDGRARVDAEGTAHERLPARSFEAVEIRASFDRPGEPAAVLTDW
jgi:hypothetical protein